MRRAAYGKPPSFIHRSGRHFARRDDGPRHPIVPCGPDLFFFPNDKGTTLRFIRDRAGRVAGHVFHHLGLDETARKVDRSARH